jgi:meso-butanediol dehydrogenase / (S,S)-butanediol dehydrogenase / diacetyl reductase
MESETKTVLVTGAAGGIGRAACERLAGKGWNVLAVDRDGAKLAWVAKANIASLVADITSEEDNAGMVAEAEKRFGGLDAAIFNAGITGGGGIEDLPMASFRQVLDVNLCGTVLGIRAALPALRRRGGGAIAVTSSTMGVAADAENWAYSASKHALIGIVRGLAREIGWQGIRINALCPGLTQDTGMTSGLRDLGEERFAMMARAVPLQRWAEASEMAAVLEFLISSASSYVNGHAMVADGGALVGTGLVPPASGPRAAGQ